MLIANLVKNPNEQDANERNLAFIKDSKSRYAITYRFKNMVSNYRKYYILAAGVMVANYLQYALAIESNHNLPAESGYWVIVESKKWISEKLTSDYDDITKRAMPCGIQTFNDTSNKFTGFSPGYNVFVIGPFKTHKKAETIKSVVLECFPSAYVKKATYAGE